jgi:indolepyruvate ferredoxin oxidoreductase
MQLASLSLDDRYTLETGRIFLTGIQALVRLPMSQRRRDLRAGLDTAGFVSGYRGSPLGGLDQQLMRAHEHRERHRIHFQPGVNEELAATAVAGTQQVNAFAGARVDGVFALWYGKAPGVDRAGDAFRHGNASGSARRGGVLVIAGDDHACKSSTLPSQSEYTFQDLGIPVLNPASVQEVLEYGLVGWALSRYSGCWVAMIALADTMDASASVDVDEQRTSITLPRDFEAPPEGLNLRLGVSPLDQEALLHGFKLEAAVAFARANGIDRTVFDAESARFGIAATGIAYLDVRQALADLGVGAREARELGLRLYKIGMPWPLDPVGVARFAEGLDEILVVEEKRGLVEGQIKEQLYHAAPERRPRVVGKRDDAGERLLSSVADLSPGRIARAIARRLPERLRNGRIEVRLEELREGEKRLAAADGMQRRAPFFCSGCPHNVSTRLPEGSRGLAGIGCHYMARWMDRNTDVFSQMGGEGIHWLGQAPFSAETHVFANLGDGTYFHSGLLAIRAAVASSVNITYKILYNDAVAMTGGQAVDGALSVPRITRQLEAEGVGRIAVVTDDPAKYPHDAGFADGVTIHARSHYEALQRELRETEGCSVIVYDQTCAAELRRRRKRGLAPDPPRRVFINEAACEGCGDCSAQSSCISIEPVETELGRKRTIDQSSCNKDYSCLEGLCPAFVTVRGGGLRRTAVDPAQALETQGELPLPEAAALEQPWNIVLTGVGGTGVVTLGALLGMAAHLEGRASTVLDMTGLAQKGGAVISHVRIGSVPEDIHTARIPTGEADALLACDLIVAASRDSVVKLDAGRTRSVVDTHIAPTAEFVLDTDVRYDPGAFLGLLHDVSHTLDTVDGTGLATALLGDAVATNIFMLGFAFQKGLIPLSPEALLAAIALNGVALEANRRAFTWGRLAAHDPETAAQAAGRERDQGAPRGRTLDDVIAYRERHLTQYQNASLAARYRARVEEARAAEAHRAPGLAGLADAVARGYHKVLAYKDEYEVARLYSDGAFEEALDARFEGDFRVELHLAPPLLARPDPTTGRPRKRPYGPWMLRMLKGLARLKRLRGTRFDVFGYTEERRIERRLIADYEGTLGVLTKGLRPDNHASAVELAALPLEIRGFGPVKLESYRGAVVKHALLMDRFRKAPAPAHPQGAHSTEVREVD